MTRSKAMRDVLRNILAVLEAERKALAGLDLDAIVGATSKKDQLCATLGEVDAGQLDEECRAMLDTARRVNEINRQVRNLVAANVAAQLDSLTGSTQVYRADPAYTCTANRA